LARTRLSARAAGAGRGAERGRGEGLLLLLPTNQKQQQKQPSSALRAPRSAPRPSRGREGVRRCASQWLASASTHPASGRRERGGRREGQAQKTRPEPGFSSHRYGASGSGLGSLDAGVQAGLVAGGLVLVDQATRAEAVEDRLGDLVGFLGGDHVVLVKRLQDLLDGGAEQRALAGVAGIAHDSLLCALLGGLDVGHGDSWKIV